MNKKCEDCGKASRSFGLVSEGRFRWCASCGKTHGGVDLCKRCEDCGVKAAQYSMPDPQDPFPTRIAKEIPKRWCTQCAKNHDGALEKGKQYWYVPNYLRC